MASIEIDGLAELRAAIALVDPTLDKGIQDALDYGGLLVADRTRANAPVRSGMLRGSVRNFTEAEGSVGGVEVTARRRSARWPGGFPYPERVEAKRGFLKSAIAQEKDRIIKRFERVLDDIQRVWGG